MTGPVAYDPIAYAECPACEERELISDVCNDPFTPGLLCMGCGTRYVHTTGCQMRKPIPPGWMFGPFSCNCDGLAAIVWRDPDGATS